MGLADKETRLVSGGCLHQYKVSKRWRDKEETGKQEKVPENKNYHNEELILQETEMAGKESLREKDPN